jgi:hypothetical protein
VAAEAFATTAIEKGRQIESKRGLIIEAFKKAEKEKAGSGPEKAEQLLFEENTFSALKVHTANGAPLGSTVGTTDLTRASSMAMPSTGGAFDAAVKAYMSKHPGVEYAAAMDIVNREQPGLYGR